MKLTDNNFLNSVILWMEVVHSEGKLNLDNLRNDASHSLRGGLLRYILDGNSPWRVPPPLYMSRPWYGLFDSGKDLLATRMEVWKMSDKGWTCENADKTVVIGQSRWDVVEEHGTGDWTLTPSEGNGGGPRCGQYRVTIKGPAEIGVHVHMYRLYLPPERWE
jgi:hypothetical protein|tara:strand:- start:34997 stop:35482 length:486 start_codon:yes stop_codon:yes gene_type:complete